MCVRVRVCVCVRGGYCVKVMVAVMFFIMLRAVRTMPAGPLALTAVDGGVFFPGEPTRVFHGDGTFCNLL